MSPRSYDQQTKPDRQQQLSQLAWKAFRRDPELSASLSLRRQSLPVPVPLQLVCETRPAVPDRESVPCALCHRPCASDLGRVAAVLCKAGRVPWQTVLASPVAPPNPTLPDAWLSSLSAVCCPCGSPIQHSRQGCSYQPSASGNRRHSIQTPY